MSDNYVVTAPYVTLRVPNELGQPVHTGFYEGAPVPEGTDQDDVDRHLRKGMIAKQGTPEADAASVVGKPVEFDKAGMPVKPDPAADAEKRAARPAPAKAAPVKAADSKA